ncbi:MAG: hypothetical protein WC028_01535 [Candidatus Obscuribacterales bacterium]
MQQSFQQPQQGMSAAPVQGAVQENQLEQELSQTPISNDPNWPTDFSNTAKNGAATQDAGGQQAAQAGVSAQPSAAAAVGSALVKTLGAVMTARSANNMYGSGYGSNPMMGGGGFGSTIGRMLGGNSYNPMMGGYGGMGGMGGMGGYGSPYGYNNSGGMFGSLMKNMISH